MELVKAFSEERTLKINLEHAPLRIPFTDLNAIQGEFKIMTDVNYARLKRTLVEDGITFVFHVWYGAQEEGETPRWWIIDGHGRRKGIGRMVEEEGWRCPDLPCVEIKAPSFKAAKKLVLNSTARFHTPTEEGLYELMSDLNLSFDEVKNNFDVPEIDFNAFKVGYFDEPGEPTEPAEPKKVEFQAYENAAIKQVVLYFASEDYKTILGRLDQLMEQMGVEDYSQVVWKLVNEKIST